MSDITQQITGILEESPGVKSSKRAFGAALIGAGSLLLLAVGAVAIFRLEPMPNAQIAISAGVALITAGAALLGVTVLEGAGSRLGAR